MKLHLFDVRPKIVLDKEKKITNTSNMPRGKPVRALEPEQIARLEEFRKSPHRGHPHGYSFTALRKAMGASFLPATLTKALSGLPVWTLHHSYIAQWIERYLPAASGHGQNTSKEAATDATLPVPSSNQRRGDTLDAAASEGENDAEPDEASGGETDELLENDERHAKKAGTTGTVRGSQ